MEQVATINLPALARVNREGKEGWVAILGMEGDTVTVSAEEGDESKLSAVEFQQMYAGEAAFVWDSSVAELATLRAQSFGSKVHELQQDLLDHTLGVLEVPAPEVHHAVDPSLDVVHGLFPAGEKALEQNAVVHAHAAPSRG